MIANLELSRAISWRIPASRSTRGAGRPVSLGEIVDTMRLRYLMPGPGAPRSWRLQRRGGGLGASGGAGASGGFAAFDGARTAPGAVRGSWLGSNPGKLGR